MKSTMILAVCLGLVGCCLASPTASISGSPAISRDRLQEILAENEQMSELSALPNDEGEVAYLDTPDQKMFDDFCKQSRDQVGEYFKQSGQDAAAGLFAVFFSSIAEVTEELASIQKEQVEKAAAVIKGEVQPLPADKKPTEDEVLEHTAQSATLLQKIGGVIAEYARALSRAAMKELYVRVALMREKATPEEFKAVITNTCNHVQMFLVPKLQQSFKNAKSEIVKNLREAGETELLAQVNQLPYDKLKCLTAGRVRKGVTMCGVFNTAGPMIYTMMGM